ncbi:MAG: HD domain-containing protein [Candidatus Magasanikbacteria bacterium]|nr:HD domain-containing protein [Candidatus Magasanikbacteria bacterium]
MEAKNVSVWPRYLEWFLWSLTRRLEEVTRWRNYEERTRENVLEHTFKSLLLTLLVIFLEKRYGRKDFDAFRLFVGDFLHDCPEGLSGDITYHVKKDPTVKKALQEIEIRLFREFLGEYLPLEIVEDIFGAFALESDRVSFEGRLFHAIEIVGYVSYALYEVEEHSRRDFTKVFATQYEELSALAEEFASINIIWQALKPRLDKHLAQQKKRRARNI